MNDIVTYVDKIEQWGRDRNIVHEHGATALAQISKLLEEVAETVGHLNDLYSTFPPQSEDLYLRASTHRGNRNLLADDIGDMLVCIIQAARLLGIPLEEALETAWDGIKDRKGTMINGKFVKEKE